METTQRAKVVCDEQHRYWEIQGSERTRIPGFTEICQDLGIIKPNHFYTEDGREEGRALHIWCLFLAKGGDPKESPDPRIAGRVEGFKKFLRESQFKFEGGEEPMLEPTLRYCGTPDLYGHLGAWAIVLDIKGGDPQSWHPIQTSAYKILLAANGFKAQKRYSLYLMDGDYRLKPHDDRDDETRWKAFVTAYNAKTHYL